MVGGLWTCDAADLARYESADWCGGEVPGSDFTLLGRKKSFLLGEQGPAENSTNRHGLRVGPQGMFPSCRMCACCFVGGFFGFFFLLFLWNSSFWHVIIKLKHSARASVPKSLSACFTRAAGVYSYKLALSVRWWEYVSLCWREQPAPILSMRFYFSQGRPGRN